MRLFFLMAVSATFLLVGCPKGDDTKTPPAEPAAAGKAADEAKAATDKAADKTKEAVDKAASETKGSGSEAK